jgi:CO/xanthine dehydrogenase FAD-binding subunit
MSTVHGAGEPARPAKAMELRAPRSMAELVAALREMTPASRFLAGGTDLVRRLNEGSPMPDLIVDLSGVGELRSIAVDAGRLRVGATATFTEIEGSATVRRVAACLAEAAAQVGSMQIRNIATVGGNVGNASPCGDTLPALLALRATATVVDGDGGCTVRPVGDLLVGPGMTSLRYDELITGFAMPVPSPGERSAFAKLGVRSAVSVARLSMAVALTCEPGTSRISDVRIALGAVGDTAFRDGALERYLEGRRADEAAAEGFAEECAAAVGRSIPGRYSLPYKEAAVRGVARDVWARLGLAGPRS